jgi:hypothetical protein
MEEKPLTLEECLNQPRGYEGRLFQPPKLERDIAAYIVLDRREETIDIEVYLQGARTEVRRGVPLEPRLQDTALTSRELFKYYLEIGRAARRSWAGLLGCTQEDKD